MSGHPPSAIWLLIAAIAIGTFALRLSFIQLAGWLEEIPAPIARALGLIPAAILAAIVFPALFTPELGLPAGYVNPRSVAAAIGAVIAWRTNSMTWTIAGGMAALWLGRLLVG